MTGRVYDLAPRLAARRAAEQRAVRLAERRAAEQRQPWRGRTLGEALFAAGLAWSMWRAHGRPHR